MIGCSNRLIQTALIRTRNRHSQTGNARSKNRGHPTGRKKRCLVTGESLGSMGDPITVTLKAKTVRVCCEACVAAVKRSPDRYLRKVAAEFARSVVAPRPAPQRQNISPSAALHSLPAQTVCPVTGEELGTMGKRISVTVDGQTIFVCCRSCVATVKRNPGKYVKSIPDLRRQR